MNDRWESAHSYDAFMGRWSRLVAREFIIWLKPLPALHWLELGCGTGALTKTILDLAEPASILACDPSEAFVSLARLHIPDERVTFAVASADRLPGPVQPLNACVFGLVLNFIPEPQTSISRIARLLAPGSLIAGYVWDYAGGMKFLRIFWDVAVELDPAAGELDEGRRFPLCAPDPLTRLFLSSGLNDVSVQSLEILTQFKDFSDYWEPFLGGTGTAPAYVRTLNSENQGHLKKSLEKRLSPGAGENIDLTARAWAVRGYT